MIGERAAAHADGVYLLYVLGYGHEGGHGAERFSQVVRVKAGDDNADATVIGQFLNHINDGFVKELGFIDAHNLNVGFYLKHAGGRFDGRAGNAVGVMGDYIQI